MAGYELAQLNITWMKAPLDLREMAEFVANLEERLTQLRQHGPSPAAFTFRNAYRAPDAEQSGERFSFTDECPA